MQCDEIKKILEKYVDHELNPTQRKSVEQHISGCSDCKAELTALLEINTVSGLNYLPDPGDEYWSALTRDISGKISRSDRAQTVKQPPWKWKFWPKLPAIRYAGIAVTALLLFFLVKTSVFKERVIDPGNLDVRSMSKAEYPLESEGAPVKTAAAKPDVGGIAGAESPKVKSLPRAAEEMEDEAISETGIRKKEIKSAEASRKDSDVLRMTDAADGKLQPQTSSQELKMETSKKVITENVVVTGGETPPVSRGVMTGGSQNRGNPVTIYGQIEEIKMTTDNGTKEDKDSESSYFATSDLAQKTEDLHKKIVIWENFITTGPNEIHLQKAKFKQAVLYYTIACSSKTEDHIETALKFYEINMPVFKQSNNLKTIENFYTKIIQLKKNRDGKN